MDVDLRQVCYFCGLENCNVNDSQIDVSLVSLLFLWPQLSEYSPVSYKMQTTLIKGWKRKRNLEPMRGKQEWN